VSGGDDKILSIWNLQHKKQEAVLKGRTDAIWSIAVTSENR
jgi:WD40 repeat protein